MGKRRISYPAFTVTSPLKQQPVRLESVWHFILRINRIRLNGYWFRQ